MSPPEAGPTAPLTNRERILFHQIHPAKLATDVSANLASLLVFWAGHLWLGLAVHFVPPVIASILVLGFGDLDRLRRSAFGAYVNRMMTRAVEAIRLLGDALMVLGAWYHSGDLIVAGLLIVVGAWLSGRAPGGSSAPPIRYDEGPP